MNEVAKPSSRKWWIAGLLLSATMINYMDRQTLANLSVRITNSLGLKEEHYGDMEFAFGTAFAVGSFFFGFLADRFGVRWLYPIVFLGWSLAGIATGYSYDYESMLLCRTVLGFFEAGHWPCALFTVRCVLAKEGRHLGNSLLQSGAAIGAILTPPIILGILSGSGPEVWNTPFIIVGAVGTIWIAGWFALIRPRDLVSPVEHSTEAGRSGLWTELLWDRRFWVLFFIVLALNITWQLLRAWLPKFLQKGRDYDEADALWFNSAFYIAADLGCILSGFAVLALAKRGWNLHKLRVGVYVTGSLICCLTIVAAMLPKGWPLLGVLLLIAAGALSLFPCYYSFVQELGKQHLGKISGILAGCGWLLSSPLQKAFGRHVDQTRSYDVGIALVGLAPLIGAIGLILFWRRATSERPGS